MWKINRILQCIFITCLSVNLVVCVAISPDLDKNATISEQVALKEALKDAPEEENEVSVEKAIKDRNPKFGFQIFPGSSTPYPNYDGINGYSDGINNVNDFGGGYDYSKLAGVGIASTAALLKGGVLGGITAIKAAILPPLFIAAVIIFLIAGAAFFTCSLVPGGCSNVFGGFGNIGSSFTNFFNRNGYEPYGTDYDSYYQNQLQPVYQALEEGYKKFQ